MKKVRSFHQIKPDDRILFIRLSALGDVINAIPTLVLLRKKFPQNYIAWCVEELSADILTDHPLIDELIVIPMRWKTQPKNLKLLREVFRFFKKIHKQHFTVVLDVHGLLKSTLIAFFSGARLRLGYDIGIEVEHHDKLLHYILLAPPNHITGPAAVQRALFLQCLGIDVSKIDYVLPPLEHQHQKVSEIYKSFAIKPDELVIAINPGAARIHKQWPVHYFRQLAEALIRSYHAKIVWTGSSDQRKLLDDISGGLPVTNSFNLVGTLSLREVAALYQRTNLLITNDTGPAHLGAAAGAFVVVIMGPTDPAFHAPHTVKKLIITPEDGVCRYCGKKACNHEIQIECMNSIKPAKVLEKVGRLIESKAWLDSNCPS